MFGIDLLSAVIGAAVFAVVIFKWPQVAVWANMQVARAWHAVKIWRAERAAKKAIK